MNEISKINALQRQQVLDVIADKLMYDGRFHVSSDVYAPKNLILQPFYQNAIAGALMRGDLNTCNWIIRNLCADIIIFWSECETLKGETMSSVLEAYLENLKQIKQGEDKSDE